MDPTNFGNQGFIFGETSISELSDGSLFLNGRSGEKVRVTKTVSANYPQQSTYGAAVKQTALADPACCGGTAKVDVEGLPYLTLVAGCNSEITREFVTVSCSYDDGATFTKQLLMEGSKAGKGGYVDIYVDNKGKAYVLWEEQYGKAMYLTTFSVADEFCKSGVSANTDTGVMFAKEDYMKKVVTKTKNMTVSSVDGVLHLETTASTQARYFEVNYSQNVTGMVDMSVYKYMLLRVRIDSSTAGDALIDTYYRTGINRANSSDSKSQTKVANDGEWHNVIVDLSDISIRGTLHEFQMRFSVDGQSTKAVVADVEGVAFFKTAAEAETYTFEWKEPQQSENTDSDLESTDNKDKGKDKTSSEKNAADTAEDVPTDEKRRGCGSSITGTVGFVVISALGVCVLKRKKQ